MAGRKSGSMNQECYENLWWMVGHLISGCQRCFQAALLLEALLAQKRPASFASSAAPGAQSRSQWGQVQGQVHIIYNWLRRLLTDCSLAGFNGSRAAQAPGTAAVIGSAFLSYPRYPRYPRSRVLLGFTADSADGADEETRSLAVEPLSPEDSNRECCAAPRTRTYSQGTREKPLPRLPTRPARDHRIVERP
jgi:hypothetical protein